MNAGDATTQAAATQAKMTTLLPMDPLIVLSFGSKLEVQTVCGHPTPSQQQLKEGGGCEMVRDKQLSSSRRSS